MNTAMVSIQLPDTLFQKLKPYHRSVLRRAKAMAILAQRGHDLSEFLQVLDSNDPLLVTARSLWVGIGVHPLAV
ncbi:MAG TPA: hypothetical protein VL334_04190 [Anaerolineae bacterium]|nr:hypothetical protein [Anaerolineae bacterium]